MASRTPSRPATPRRVRLLIATRKGLWTLTSDASRRAWKLAGPQFLGHIVHHAVLDPRDGRTLLAAARTGHLGPDRLPLDRQRPHLEGSRDAAGVCAGQRTRRRSHVLAHAGASRRSRASGGPGTSPQGLFRSEDGGATWEGVAGFNAHPQRKAWCGGDQDGTPDGAKLHSILVDPRDALHMYISMSSGGTFESHDGGADWRPLNQGVRADFQPDPDLEFGHDPHCVRFAGGNPDRLYQQNHCGLFRLDRPATRWTDIGTGMPKSVGYVGFPMVPHPHDPETAWIFPMDGTTSGRACRPAASRPRTGRATAASRGSGRPTACRRRRRGGRSSGRR